MELGFRSCWALNRKARTVTEIGAIPGASPLGVTHSAFVGGEGGRTLVVGLSRKSEQVVARWMLWNLDEVEVLDPDKVVSFGPWKVDVLDLHRGKRRIQSFGSQCGSVGD